jgi:tRNA 2-thiouridine synthesizing protein A
MGQHGVTFIYYGSITGEPLVKRPILMADELKADAVLDSRGYSCPDPIFLIADKMKEINAGQILKVDSDDPAAEEDVKGWVKRTGHNFLRIERSGKETRFYIQKVR